MNEIAWRTVIIVAAAIAAAVALVLLLAGYLTRPITRVVAAMQKIIATSDLSQRVVVEYHDEIGQLAQTFNLMTGELEKAYGRIKRHAFEKVKAQKQEEKLKNVFRSYVPGDVIEYLFAHPEGMLVGKNEVLAVLFCGIGNFPAISAVLNPHDLVTLLNRYFEVMVDMIFERHGIVDKYIDDTIMALFGAPVKREQDVDAVDSVRAGMRDDRGPEGFQRRQKAAGGPELSIERGGQLRGGHRGEHRHGQEDGLHGDRRHGEPRLAPAGAHEELPPGPAHLGEPVPQGGRTRCPAGSSTRWP